MLRRIFNFFVALVCFFCSSLGLVPVLGGKTEAHITDNSSRIVNVERNGRQVYVRNKNGYEKPMTKTEYTYSYEFSVNGEKFTGESYEDIPVHKKGGTTTVYYIPFYPKIHTDMKPIKLYGLCGLCFLCGLVFLRSAITGRRAAINIGGSDSMINFGPKNPTLNPADYPAPVQNPQPVQQIIQPQPQQFVQTQQIIQPQPQQMVNAANPKGYSFCPKCGTALGVGYAFCPKCGFKC